MVTVVAIVLLLIAFALVALPFLQAEPEPEPRPADFEGSRADLEHRKLEAYVAIRDVEMDYRMGKLSDADYAAVKSKYTNQAIEALAALDTAPPEQPAVSSAPQSATQSAPVEAGEIRFCPDCGTSRPEGARFCPSCGRGLLAA